MTNPFLKYVSHEKKEDIFHSSAYGKAQNGSNMGAASSESFADRRKMERNRQVIRGYNDARVVSQAVASSGTRAKVYEPPVDVGGGIAESGARISAGVARLDPQVKRFEPRVAKSLGNPGKR